MSESAAPDTPEKEDDSFIKSSHVYQEFLAELEEIKRHKWLESEKAGHDIGFDKALLDWIIRHRSTWKEKRARERVQANTRLPQAA